MESVLILEYIGKDFTRRVSATIGMHWKGFYNKNALEKIFLI